MPWNIAGNIKGPKGDKGDPGNAADVAALIHAAISKTPADADELPLLDSTGSWGLRKFTWETLKSTLQSLFFYRGNILGTVSQSGGVPTGAIIQRGRNANGDFVRFADGTMICWRVSDPATIAGAAGSVFVNGAALGPYAWPASFSSVPREMYSGQKLDSPAGHCWAASASKGNASQSGTLQLFRASASSDIFYAEIFAIGRWFE